MTHLQKQLLMFMVMIVSGLIILKITLWVYGDNILPQNNLPVQNYPLCM